jgi:hypothetical protein
MQEAAMLKAEQSVTATKTDPAPAGSPMQFPPPPPHTSKKSKENWRRTAELLQFLSNNPGRVFCRGGRVSARERPHEQALKTAQVLLLLLDQRHAGRARIALGPKAASVPSETLTWRAVLKQAR